MRSWLKTVFTLMVILLLSTIFLALMYRPSEPLTIPETPRRYVEVNISLSRIVPERIEVVQGTHVFLNITSTDVEHVFQLASYGITVRVQGNETVGRDFLANILGTHEFRCIVVSPDHAGERGELVVTEG
jgi:heme/copper-type cytochrome/quinol oxidase subunit 2